MGWRTSARGEVFLDAIVSPVEILLDLLREVGMSLAIHGEVMSPPSGVIRLVDHQTFRDERAMILGKNTERYLRLK